jgi:hypothetical protein
MTPSNVSWNTSPPRWYEGPVPGMYRADFGAVDAFLTCFCLIIVSVFISWYSRSKKGSEGLAAASGTFPISKNPNVQKSTDGK